MVRILLTGMSGTGKTSSLDELRRRGHRTVDTDYGGWKRVDGAWDETRMTDLLTTNRDVVVSGTAENQSRFYDRFDYVVLLNAPLDVLLERVAAGTNNPYGHTPDRRAEIRRYISEVEPMLRRGATLELDGRRPVEELADIVEHPAGGPWTDSSGKPLSS